MKKLFLKKKIKNDMFMSFFKFNVANIILFGAEIYEYPDSSGESYHSREEIVILYLRQQYHYQILEKYKSQF